MSTVLPFPVRLDDMRAADERYQHGSEPERASIYAALTFYGLLNDGERAALERRFPNELELEPTDPEASAELKRTWDARAHDLVRCMRGYGDEVLARHMDLVGHVAPDARVAVLALTATGSVVALGPADGEQRSFEYRPSPRAERGPLSGVVTATEPIVLGNALRLAGRNTSEVIVLAAGIGAT